MKKEFSKMMIIVDYIFMIILVILSFFQEGVSTIAVAWIGQLAVSTGFYYWKAKNENRVKIPFQILETLDKENKESIDLTQVITSIVDKD